MQEPIWWNRPLQSDNLVKQEADGLWSYNLPIIVGNAGNKSQYNMLLNKNSVPVAIHLKMNPVWTDLQKERLKSFMLKTVYQVLIELGVDKENLAFSKNDLLYKGKKFLGDEQKISNGVFTENTIITLEYTPEKEIFERLTGKYALARGITGIIEETNCFTKEQFIEKLLEKIKLFLDTLK